jgi:hypothetical protein
MVLNFISVTLKRFMALSIPDDFLFEPRPQQICFVTGVGLQAIILKDDAIRP